jgi:hypothetical protein
LSSELLKKKNLRPNKKEIKKCGNHIAQKTEDYKSRVYVRMTVLKKGQRGPVVNLCQYSQPLGKLRLRRSQFKASPGKKFV